MKTFRNRLIVAIVALVVITIIAPQVTIFLAKTVYSIGYVLYVVCTYAAVALIYAAPFMPYIIALVGLLVIARAVRRVFKGNASFLFPGTKREARIRKRAALQRFAQRVK